MELLQATVKHEDLNILSRKVKYTDWKFTVEYYYIGLITVKNLIDNDNHCQYSQDGVPINRMQFMSWTKFVTPCVTIDFHELGHVKYTDNRTKSVTINDIEYTKGATK